MKIKIVKPCECLYKRQTDRGEPFEVLVDPGKVIFGITHVSCGFDGKPLPAIDIQNKDEAFFSIPNGAWIKLSD